jgi:hypothetical protein
MIQFALTALSLGAMAAGTVTQMSGARRSARAQQNIVGLERQAEGQRLKAMELDARRRQLEVIRNQQRARSLALTTATAQGAAQGSVLGGAYGQIRGQTMTNLQGIQENLGIGRNLFDINSQIGTQRIAASQAATTASMGSGISSLGGALLSSLPTLSNLTGGFGTMNTTPSAGGGYNSIGTPMGNFGMMGPR